MADSFSEAHNDPDLLPTQPKPRMADNYFKLLNTNF